MNKQFLIIGMAVLFICVGLSGCNEINLDIGGLGVEVIDYNVVTRWAAPNPEGWGVIDYEEPGFYHNISKEIPSNYYYKISGTVKNNAGRKIDVFYVIIRFYDKDNNELDARQKLLTNLANNYTKSFSFKYPDAFGGWEYFDYADHVNFEVSEEPKEGVIVQYT